MRFLLDTNICIAYLNGADDAVRDRLTSSAPRDLGLCSIVKAELLFGARKSTRVSANLARLEVFFAAFGSHDFDDAAAEQYGIIRAQLEAAGTPIGANDLAVASIAMSRDLTLVSRNVEESRRVPGLRLERW